LLKDKAAAVGLKQPLFGGYPGSEPRNNGPAMTSSDMSLPKPTAQVEPYFNILGLDDTLRFIEAFGGTEVYIADNPQSRSSDVAVLGYDKAKGLAEVSYLLQRRVPLAKKWRALTYKARGMTTVQIARKLCVTDVSVRSWLRAGR